MSSLSLSLSFEVFTNPDFLRRSENLLSTDSFLLSITTVYLTWSVKRRYQASGRHSQNVLTNVLVCSSQLKLTVALIMSATCFILQMLKLQVMYIYNTLLPDPHSSESVSEPSLRLLNT